MTTRKRKLIGSKRNRGIIVHRMDSDWMFAMLACGRPVSAARYYRENTWRGVNCKSCLKHK